jgi:hypothetical protein
MNHVAGARSTHPGSASARYPQTELIRYREHNTAWGCHGLKLKTARCVDETNLHQGSGTGTDSGGFYFPTRTVCRWRTLLARSRFLLAPAAKRSNRDTPLSLEGRSTCSPRALAKESSVRQPDLPRRTRCSANKGRLSGAFRSPKCPQCSLQVIA